MDGSLAGHVVNGDNCDCRRTHQEAEEVKSLRRIISAFLNYPNAAEHEVRRYERYFQKLPPRHKALLSHHPFKFQNLRRCISANTKFIYNMLQMFEPPFDMRLDQDFCRQSCSKTSTVRNPRNLERKFCSDLTEVINEGLGCDKSAEANCREETISSSHGWLDPSLQFKVPLIDVDKVHCIIRNIVRDWALEGKKERDQCYRPILEELERLFPDQKKDGHRTCLVPGAGLGRLALEISFLGFITQGNEFSYYMLMCSNFILNHAERKMEWVIHPWIHSNCNSRSDDDQLRPVLIPDIHPASEGITEGFSMCAGDFVEVYSDPTQAGSWDVVVTCFFLDTAHNIIEYIDIIWRVLKEGGVWINLGPLLYHFADTYGQEDHEISIELSLEDVKKIAIGCGFHLEKEETVETTYTTNPLSMMQNRYYAEFWTMVKRSEGDNNRHN